jgi:hypothetical protein
VSDDNASTPLEFRSRDRRRRGEEPSAAARLLRYLTRHPVRRRVALGVLLLVLGIGSAAGLYWVRTHSGEKTMEQMLPGYSRANRRQMGIFYGKAGEQMWGWLEDLARPDTQAAIIGIVTGLVAMRCFRSAWLRAEEMRAPVERDARAPADRLREPPSDRPA